MYDHSTVCATFKFRTKSQKNNSSKPRDFKALKNSSSIQNNYEKHISQNINKNDFDKDNTSESITNLQTVVTDAITACVPLRKSAPIRKRAVSDKTKELIKERQRKFNRMSQEEQRAATKAISQSNREDYRAYIDSMINDIASAEAVGNTREVNRLVKTLGGKTYQPSPMPSKDLQGDPIVSSEQLLAEWNTFLTAKFAPPDIDQSAQRETTVCEEDHLNDEELTTCLNGLSDNKAPGGDNIPIEAYKYSPTAREELFRIIRLIWDTEEVPPHIVNGVFIMLYKKKCRDDFKNYRAICLLCHAYKLLSAVIAKRLSIELQDVLPDSQAGFRPARETSENVCILKWTIDMLINENKPAVVTFIDYTAAFDTVRHISRQSSGHSRRLNETTQSRTSDIQRCIRLRTNKATRWERGTLREL